MSRNKRPKYSPEICGRMYRFFLGYEDRGLPQYQKDEIGEKIKEMREELRSYEATVEN